MSRFFKRLFFALITLGLGALAYALVRAESATEPRPAAPRGSGKAGAPKPPGSAAQAEPRVCAGETTSGKRCSRPAQPGSRYCWQHAE